MKESRLKSIEAALNGNVWNDGQSEMSASDGHELIAALRASNAIRAEMLVALKSVAELFELWEGEGTLGPGAETHAEVLAALARAQAAEEAE